MTGARPAPAQIIANRARAPHETGKAGRRASHDAPQQPEDQQGQDRAARPDVPVGVMIVDRPPAERDQTSQQPVNQPNRQVPDRLRLPLRRAQWCISVRYLSWHALQACSRLSKRALIKSRSLPAVAPVKAPAATWKSWSFAAKST